MKIFGKNTMIARRKKEMPKDLDGFSKGPPQHRLDDKAAELEQEIQSLKVECRRIYFVLSFIANSFFLLFVASVANKPSITIATILSLILLIGLAKWLDFPWVTVNLQNWLDTFHKKKDRDEPEPIPDQTKPGPSD